MRYITESDIEYTEAFLSDRFIILNMWGEGIWLVDKQHSEFEKIKETAIQIAKTFDDKKTISQLSEL